ncbi:unnamed protein product [Phyllotreta striolata]|uniref:Uncharacterized protein n=1 Tax=Phyllotreta striolata TaxID=444603 RepID=A0A9N9XRL8_PHYSR|nr:unnamed protein product [Phyllotreta striolata]
MWHTKKPALGGRFAAPSAAPPPLQCNIFRLYPSKDARLRQRPQTIARKTSQKPARTRQDRRAARRRTSVATRRLTGGGYGASYGTAGPAAHKHYRHLLYDFLLVGRPQDALLLGVRAGAPSPTAALLLRSCYALDADSIASRSDFETGSLIYSFGRVKSGLIDANESEAGFK